MAIDYVYVTTEDQLYDALKEIKEYINDPLWNIHDSKPIVALDCETFGELLYKKRVPLPIEDIEGEPTGFIRMLQIGLNPVYTPKRPFYNRQFVFDVLLLGITPIRKYFKFLEDVIVIGHNLKYDYQFMFSQLGINLKYMKDTMLISKVLLAGDPVDHGLDAAYKRFLDWNFFKQETKSKEFPEGLTPEQYVERKKKNQLSDWSGEIATEQVEYAAEDVYFPFFLIEQEQEWLNDYIRTHESDTKPNQKIVSIINLENKLIEVFAQAELRGAPFSSSMQKEVITVLEERMKEALDHLGLTRKRKVRRFNEWCLLSDKQVHRIASPLYKVVWEEEIEEPINMRSPQQLAPIISGIFAKDLGEGFRVTKLEKGEEKDTTGEDEIKDAFYRNEENLSDETKQKIRWILQYKKASSLLSKFGQKHIDFCTKRGYIHCNWFQIGEDETAIDTGRSSSSKPNLMQIPSRDELFTYSEYGSKMAGELFRAPFKAKEGWKFVVADFSQIEPRIAAEFCRVKELIKKYQDDAAGIKKFDMHAWVAKIMMDLPVEPDSKSYERKYIGKTAGLSVLYGKWWTTLKEWMFKKTDGRVRWNDDQAKAAWENFFTNAPEFRTALASWDRRVRTGPESYNFSLSYCKKNNPKGKIPFIVAKTMMGRPRRFTLHKHHFELPDEALCRDYRDPSGRVNAYSERLRAARVEGFNHHIQGTAADIMKLALLYTHTGLKDAGFDWTEGIVLLVHDEIALHVKEEHAELAKEILEKSMVRAGSEVLKLVPIKAVAGIGGSWHSAKPD